MILDIRPGLTETSDYKAWKFPGGELHITLSKAFLGERALDYHRGRPTTIKCHLNSSDDLMLLILTVEVLRNATKDPIHVLIPYMAYQQADQRFKPNECFSLQIVCNILNSLPVDRFYIFDPHSDVSPALLRNCRVINNTEYIKHVIAIIQLAESSTRLTLLAPDAGAYKKIFKLAENLGFKGQVKSCAKSRNHETGQITVEVPEISPDEKILIVDDICLAGNTFIKIAEKLPKECAKYLAVSHGVFNEGVEKLSEYFKRIFTTDSRGKINLEANHFQHGNSIYVDSQNRPLKAYLSQYEL